MNWYNKSELHKKAQLQDQEVYKLVGVVQFVVSTYQRNPADAAAIKQAMDSLVAAYNHYDSHAATQRQQANDAVKNFQMNPIQPPPAQP
jgi:hypothetical protein